MSCWIEWTQIGCSSSGGWLSFGWPPPRPSAVSAVFPGPGKLGPGRHASGQAGPPVAPRGWKWMGMKATDPDVRKGRGKKTGKP